MINFFASLLKWELSFFGLFRDKIRNMGKCGWQKNSRHGAFEKVFISSILVPLMWGFLKEQSWFYGLIYLGSKARHILGGDTLFLVDSVTLKSRDSL